MRAPTARERRDIDWRIKRLRQLAAGAPSFDAARIAYRYGLELARMARALTTQRKGTR